MVSSVKGIRLMDLVRNKINSNPRLKRNYQLVDDWSREEDDWVYLVVTPKPQSKLRAIDAVDDLEQIEQEISAQENVNLLLLPAKGD